MFQKIIRILQKRPSALMALFITTFLLLASCGQNGSGPSGGSIGPDGDFSVDIPKAVLENTTGLALTAILTVDDGRPPVELTITGGEVNTVVNNLSLGKTHTFTIKYLLGGVLFASWTTSVEVTGQQTDVSFSIEKLNLSPTATVRFPTKKSLTNGKTLTVTGTASDADGIEEVWVNGGLANTTDAFKTWTVPVDLSPGKNIIDIKTKDKSGHMNPKAETVEVTRSELLIDPKQVALDINNNRAYVVDDSLDAILAVDLVTGVRTIVSDATHGSGINFKSPMGIALDTNGDVYVTDNDWKALIKVDLKNTETLGNRDIVSGGIGTIKGTGPLLANPVSVAIEGGNAYVVDRGLKALILSNLSNGNRTVASGCPNSITACPGLGSRGSGADFEIPFGLVLNIDGSNNRAFVTDIGRDELIEVNLNGGSGDRTTKAGGFNNPLGIALDLVNNRVLVANSGDKKILAVDLDGGAVTAFSDGSTGSGTPFIKPLGLALDPIKNRLFVTDDGLDALFALELANGDRSIISDSATGTATNFFGQLSGIALDLPGNRAFVVDNGLKGLLSVDLLNGDRAIISNLNNGSGTNGDENNFFVTPRGIALDLTNRLAYVIDEGLDALLSVNLAEGVGKGDRTIVSDINNGGGTAFNIPLGIALDLGNSKAFVIDEGLDALLSVNLAEGVSKGDRTIVSDNSDPFTTFISPRGLGLDLNRNLAFVIDDGRDELLSVDLSVSNGSREPASNGGPGPALINPLGVALDPNPKGSRAYIIDEGLNALLSVDLADGLTKGNRRIISNIDSGVGTHFMNPSGLALDIANNRAFVIDPGLNALSLVELESGDRVIVSR